MHFANSKTQKKATQFTPNYIFPIQKPHHIHQNEEKEEPKKIYKNKPVRLCNWNQPNRHVQQNALTVIKRKNEPKSK